MNPIRKVLQTRIENLVKLANVAAEVSHNATIGSLRESYLTDFFKELIPEGVVKLKDDPNQHRNSNCFDSKDCIASFIF